MMMMTMFFLPLEWRAGAVAASVLHTRTDNGQSLDDIVGSLETNEPMIVRVAQSPHLLSFASRFFLLCL